MLEELIFSRALKVPTDLDVRRATCEFIGTLILHRNIGLETMRQINGINPKTGREETPHYHAILFDSTDSQIKNTINQLIPICRTAAQRGIKRVDETTWYALRNASDSARTSRNLVTLILEKTAVPWNTHPCAKSGNTNGNNYFRMLSWYVYFISRSVYSQSTEEKYTLRGYEHSLFSRAAVRSLIDDITKISVDSVQVFTTWHELGEPDEEEIDIAHENASQRFSVMRQTHAQEANAFMNDVYRKMLRSDVFSMPIKDSNSRKTRVLKRDSRTLLEQVISACSSFMNLPTNFLISSIARPQSIGQCDTS